MKIVTVQLHKGIVIHLGPYACTGGNTALPSLALFVLTDTVRMERFIHELSMLLWLVQYSVGAYLGNVGYIQLEKLGGR